MGCCRLKEEAALLQGVVERQLARPTYGCVFSAPQSGLRNLTPDRDRYPALHDLSRMGDWSLALSMAGRRGGCRDDTTWQHSVGDNHSRFARSNMT